MTSNENVGGGAGAAQESLHPNAVDGEECVLLSRFGQAGGVRKARVCSEGGEEDKGRRIERVHEGKSAPHPHPTPTRCPHPSNLCTRIIKKTHIHTFRMRALYSFVT